MKPRFAIRDVLLLTGLGAGVLAVLLLLPGWLGPGWRRRAGPTPTETPVPLPTALLPTVPPWPTIIAGVPALPVPIPTNVAPSIPPPLCGGSRFSPPVCTPVPILPTPVPPLLSPTPWPGTLQADETGGKDYGVWSYGYGVIHANDETAASVYYDTRTVEAIQAYAAANRALAADLAQTGGGVRVDVAFRAPVAPAQFLDWARAHGFYNGWFGVRVLDRRARGPVAVPLYFRGGLPDWLLQGQLQPVSVWSTIYPALPTPVQPPGVEDSAPLYLVSGVYYLTGMVDVQQLPGIVTDPLVFLADVTPNVVRRDLLSKGVLVVMPDMMWVAVRPASPFWRMEDLGLEHFR